MEMNPYALEMLAEDRLRRARREAADWALASRAARQRRAAPRVRVGLLLIRAGRWLRRSGVGGRRHGVLGGHRSGVAGGSVGPKVA